MNASIVANEFPVEHTAYADREFLKFTIDNGWDDVKKLKNKVLLYDGRKFTFGCWNSDGNYIVFVRINGVEPKVAKFV